MEHENIPRRKRHRRNSGYVDLDRVILLLVSIVAASFLVLWLRSDSECSRLRSENARLVIEKCDLGIDYSNRLVSEGKKYEELYSQYLEEREKSRSFEAELQKLEIPRMKHEVTLSDLMLLCRLVRAEAGTDSESQAIATGVVLNRLQDPSFPDTMHEVVYQKENGVPQFSAAYNGGLDSQVVDTVTFNTVMAVLCDGVDIPDNVLYFYSAKLEEDNWVKTLEVYKTVGGTVYCYGRK